jgi:sulfopyruvate decarboxylase subunit alpha
VDEGKMSDPQRRAPLILAALKSAGIDLISTLPDAWLGELIAEIEADPAMKLVRLTREDEGLGICAGAYLGGRRAAVLAQNAGLLLSTNVLAGLAYHHQIPALMLIANRGGVGDNQYYHAYKGRVTEPVLAAVGVPYHVVNGPEDFHIIAGAWDQAALYRMPVVVLLNRGALFAPKGS